MLSRAPDQDRPFPSRVAWHGTTLWIKADRIRAGETSADDPHDHRVGRAVRKYWKYRLDERIASGGMGVVYRARRVDGVFDQEVAVKRVRAETATREMRVRFEFERQARARLNHPNIATVLNGGTTEGTPVPVRLHGSV